MENIITNINQVSSDFRRIKEKLVEKGVEISDNMHTAEYVDKIDDVYQSGLNIGYVDGYNTGVADSTPSVDPNWTDWRHLFSYDTRLDLRAKIKFTDTSNGINFGSMFYYCQKTLTPPLLDTSKGENFGSMFGYCRQVTRIPAYDISNASSGTGSLNGMFQYCTEVTQILIDFEAAQPGIYNTTFSDCQKLNHDIRLNSGMASNFHQTFYHCYALPSVSRICFSGNLTNKMTSTFEGCTALTYIGIEGTLYVTLSLKDCPLEIECARNILRALADNTGTVRDGQHSITFKSDIKTALLEDTETAPDGTTWDEWVINRGWTW